LASAYGASVIVGDHPVLDLLQVVHLPAWLKPREDCGDKA
jgi:hypothetical protein